LVHPKQSRTERDMTKYISKPVRNTAKHLVKHHPTPLHDLMHRYSIKPEQIETVETVRFNMHWTLTISTEIIMDPDKAIESISNNPDMKIFTDGSGME
jgi:hypothetical protein